MLNETSYYRTRQWTAIWFGLSKIVSVVLYVTCQLVQKADDIVQLRKYETAAPTKQNLNLTPGKKLISQSSMCIWLQTHLIFSPDFV